MVTFSLEGEKPVVTPSLYSHSVKETRELSCLKLQPADLGLHGHIGKREAYIFCFVFHPRLRYRGGENRKKNYAKTKLPIVG